MEDFFFFLFSALTLGSALMVVCSRNAAGSALALILSFLGMASLFVMLEAWLLAVLQVLVYAGAVVVLFLFIIMLVDARGGRSRAMPQLGGFFAICAFALMLAAVFSLFGPSSPLPGAVVPPGPGLSLKEYGAALFTTYLLPLQVAGFLLLVAMIGVVVICRRPPGLPQAPDASTPSIPLEPS